MLQVFESTVDASMPPNTDDVSLAIDDEANAVLVCGWRRGMLNIAVRRSLQMEHKRVLRRFKKIEKEISDDRPRICSRSTGRKGPSQKYLLLLDLKYDQVMK